MGEAIELEMEDDDTPLLVAAYFAHISLDEARRFMCLDMARCLGAPSDKALKVAQEFERFLTGKKAVLDVVK